MGATEVTQTQWQAIMGSAPGHVLAIMGSTPSENSGVATFPVEQVSFYDVQEFIKKLNARTGERFRLPTEWEWEYAARAGTGTARYWDEPIGRNHANCDGCGSGWDNRQTAPVRSFTANAFGLHDMLGNVEEWTCSEYKDHYDGHEKKCADRASYYSLRGGSWLNKPRFVRSARRNYGVPDHRYGTLGFRRARD
jgi:formylglycine-generating enzyme required for sulfatase activity